MSNETKFGNQLSIFTTIVFRDSVDFSPTTANDLRNGDNYTYVQWDGSNRAQNEAFQSAIFDLGTDRAPQYDLWLCSQYAATPADGDTWSFWIAPSLQSTASLAMAGYPLVDGVADGIADEIVETDALFSNIKRIGSASIRAIATPQIALVGTYIPTARHGVLVSENDSTISTDTGVADEIHAILVPSTFYN